MRSSAPYSPGEEVAHWLTHGVGILASLVAIPLLAVTAAVAGDAWRLTSGVIFGASALLLFTTSVLYHAVQAPRAKARLRLLDHSAIYLLIAGSYTPFTLGVLRGAWGWTLFGVVWGLAVIGILHKILLGFRFPRLSTLMYLGMGWLAVVAAGPLVRALPAGGLAWLVAGGLCYSLGVIWYVRDHLPYRHALWHLLVLAGSACHYTAVYRYATGPLR